MSRIILDETRRAQASRVSAWSRLLVLGMLAGLLLILVRVAQLKLRPDASLRAALTPPISTRAEPARRGDIVDARGRVLATSTLGYRLFIDPTQVQDIRTIAVDLAAAIGAAPDEIDRKILAGGAPRYVVIDDLLDDRQVAAVRTAGLRGVGLQPRQVRHYPQHERAARVVGMVGFEHTGLSGSEHAFDRMLAGRQGRLSYLRDVRHRTLWFEPDDYEPATDGREVRLTIDLVVQEIAERHLRRAVDEYEAGGGRVVVLDCISGAILALTDVLAEPAGPARLARNRCVTDPYEPGSTLKPFIWAVATELGRAHPAEIIPCPVDRPYRTPYGRSIRDSHYLGPVSWRNVLVQSLNTGMAIVAARMTHDEMRQAITRFGFGRRTRCGIPGETAGLVTPASRWSDYTQSSVSFGHEIAVTPVQMVRAFSAFARHGMLPTVHIVAGPGAGANVPRFRFVRQVCSASTADLVREILGEVMIEGTGRHAQSQRYRLFGKSGTAQLPRPDGGGYFEDRYVSSFIAGAPLHEPRVVVLCVIDDPDRSRGHWGGRVAGPVVRDVIDETLAYLAVIPDHPLPVD